MELLGDKKAISSVHVTFDESSFPGLDIQESSSSGGEIEWKSEDHLSSDNDSSKSDSDVFPPSYSSNLEKSTPNP